MTDTLKYNIVDGTSYNINTSKEVVQILERSRTQKMRIRLFYGDIKTGIDWKEEHYIIGIVGRSTGINKIPILLKNNNSMGGCGILDRCIVKITINKKTVYIHPTYKLTNEGYAGTINETSKDFFEVIFDGKVFATFKTLQKAQNYIKFLRGIRNRI